ncbi:MAG: hypothetical protein N3I35_03020 [Clostridia bacterium]|nr:hypothetical protein [Clostridia bacterium]
MKVVVKRQKLAELMETYFSGNYNRFARELDVDPSHLHRFINSGIGGGKKIVGATIRFCKSNGLNYEEYIEI